MGHRRMAPKDNVEPEEAGPVGYAEDGTPIFAPPIPPHKLDREKFSESVRELAVRRKKLLEDH